MAVIRVFSADKQRYKRSTVERRLLKFSAFFKMDVVVPWQQKAALQLYVQSLPNAV